GIVRSHGRHGDWPWPLAWRHSALVIGGSRRPAEVLPMSSEDAVIDVRHLTKSYEVYAAPRDRLKQFILPKLHRLGAATRLSRRTDPVRYYREFQALQDVSFQVRRGETVGIIGR